MRERTIELVLVWIAALISMSKSRSTNSLFPTINNPLNTNLDEFSGEIEPSKTNSKPNPNPKPVFLVHGAFLSNESLAYMVEKIKQDNANREVWNSNAYPLVESLTVSMPDQINGQLGHEFREFSQRHPRGFHVICHSAAVLMCRALIQNNTKHNVHTFVMIGAPNAGVYGFPTLLPLPIPELQPPFLISPTIRFFFFLPVVQRHLSLANTVNEPFHQELYLKNNIFLPYINNEIRTKYSERYKEAFSSLQLLIAIAGPDDAVIQPWQSGYWSFFNEKGELVDYHNRTFYKEDLIGLRKLEEEGKFIKCIKSGVGNFKWITNDYIIDKCIIPYLT